jgi:hypothetical protein
MRKRKVSEARDVFYNLKVAQEEVQKSANKLELNRRELSEAKGALLRLVKEHGAIFHDGHVYVLNDEGTEVVCRPCVDSWDLKDKKIEQDV